MFSLSLSLSLSRSLALTLSPPPVTQYHLQTIIYSPPSPVVGRTISLAESEMKKPNGTSHKQIKKKDKTYEQEIFVKHIILLLSGFTFVQHLIALICASRIMFPLIPTFSTHRRPDIPTKFQQCKKLHNRHLLLLLWDKLGSLSQTQHQVVGCTKLSL